ncbi:unnamed protein product [Adineta ricciae]|uniref:ADP-ribosylglycohydrolase n=1 Tax=Adineta ricciae TaxID=249248 RepID=A0A814Q6W4_ADIRI|nr:unnamed protein product [Adineta ricciae]CAF1115560.1 unnamed protein product [Adineta ricciae]
MAMFPSYKENKLPHEIALSSPPNIDIQGTQVRRFIGSIFGLAVGDALGARVEFRPYEYLVNNPVKDMKGGGTWGLEAGQWTDDTSMALCLAASLITKRCYDPYDQMVRYKWWYRFGYLSSTGKCFDIGNATRDAIETFVNRQRELTKSANFQGSDVDSLEWAHVQARSNFEIDCSSPGVAGNGALMRLAPVPLFFFKHPQLAVEYAGRSARLTHGDTKAVDACRYYAALIVAAVNNATKDELLSDQFYEKHKTWFSSDDLCREVLEIAHGSYRNKKGYKGGIRGKGYIVSALQAALWAFWSTKDFEDGALAAVNLGDDTDTTAAIYGQLAGAHYGYDQLPEKWTKKVYAHGLLVQTGQWLYCLGSEYQCTDDEQEFILSGKTPIASTTPQQGTKKMLAATQSLYPDTRSNYQTDLHSRLLHQDDSGLGQALTPETQVESTRLSTDYRTQTRPAYRNPRSDPRYFVNAGDYGHSSHADSFTSQRSTPWELKSSSLAITNTNRSNTPPNSGLLGYPPTMTHISTHGPTGRRLERHSEISSTSTAYNYPSQMVTNTGLRRFDHSGTQRADSTATTTRSREQLEHSTINNAIWNNTHGTSNSNLRSNNRNFPQVPMRYDMPSTAAINQYSSYKKK